MGMYHFTIFAFCRILSVVTVNHDFALLCNELAQIRYMYNIGIVWINWFIFITALSPQVWGLYHQFGRKGIREKDKNLREKVERRAKFGRRDMICMCYLAKFKENFRHLNLNLVSSSPGRERSISENDIYDQPSL